MMIGIGKGEKREVGISPWAWKTGARRTGRGAGRPAGVRGLVAGRRPETG